MFVVVPWLELPDVIVKSRQGVSLMMDFIRQARLQPMAFGSYISTIHSDMSFVSPETSASTSSGNKPGRVSHSQNDSWFDKIWGAGH